MKGSKVVQYVIAFLTWKAQNKILGFGTIFAILV